MAPDQAEWAIFGSGSGLAAPRGYSEPVEWVVFGASMAVSLTGTLVFWRLDRHDRDMHICDCPQPQVLHPALMKVNRFGIGSPCVCGRLILEAATTLSPEGETLLLHKQRRELAHVA